jgi:hypothetical protein
MTYFRLTVSTESLISPTLKTEIATYKVDMEVLDVAVTAHNAAFEIINSEIQAQNKKIRDAEIALEQAYELDKLEGTTSVIVIKNPGKTYTLLAADGTRTEYPVKTYTVVEADGTTKEIPISRLEILSSRVMEANGKALAADFRASHLKKKLEANAKEAKLLVERQRQLKARGEELSIKVETENKVKKVAQLLGKEKILVDKLQEMPDRIEYWKKQIQPRPNSSMKCTELLIRLAIGKKNPTEKDILKLKEFQEQLEKQKQEQLKREAEEPKRLAEVHTQIAARNAEMAKLNEELTKIRSELAALSPQTPSSIAAAKDAAGKAKDSVAPAPQNTPIATASEQSKAPPPPPPTAAAPAQTATVASEINAPSVEASGKEKDSTIAASQTNSTAAKAAAIQAQTPLSSTTASSTQVASVQTKKSTLLTPLGSFTSNG